MVKNKYGARRIELKNGMKFDSTKERDRYCQLLHLEKIGEIANLKRQVRFRILPEVKLPIPGEQRKYSHISERHYTADFVYWDALKQCMIVEDVKSQVTSKLQDYQLRKHLMILKIIKHIARRGRSLWYFLETY